MYRHEKSYESLCSMAVSGQMGPLTLTDFHSAFCCLDELRENGIARTPQENAAWFFEGSSFHISRQERQYQIQM